MPKRIRADLDALDELSRSQSQCLSLAQLQTCGVPSSTIAHRTRPEGGNWHRILPGVVLLHRGTPTADERVNAALLFAGEGAVVTGLEALRRHGLRRLPSDPTVHVLVPHARRPAGYGFVIVERTRRLPAPDPTSRPGPTSRPVATSVPIASVARALVDAARRSRLTETRAVVAEAIQRRLCTTEQLLAELRTAQRRGTAGMRVVAREIVAGVRSAMEAEFRIVLRRAGLPDPLWNHDLMSLDGEFIGCPDAWWPEGLAAEVDSREFHLDPAGWEETQRRRARFARFGVHSIPVTPSRLFRDQDRLVADIRGALQAARSRPRPGVMAVLRSQAA